MAGGQVYRSIALPDTSTSSNSLWDSYRPYRIYPGKVSVSRSICDHCLKSGNQGIIIAEPELLSFPASQDDLFLLISDGVYERISNREIAEQFGCVRGKKGLQECVEKLFAKLASRNSQDNRSIVLVRIKGAGKTVG